MTKRQAQCLLWFSARYTDRITIDRFGRACVDRTGETLVAEPSVLLRLVAYGYIAGGQTSLRITAVGQSAAVNVGVDLREAASVNRRAIKRDIAQNADYLAG